MSTSISDPLDATLLPDRPTQSPTGLQSGDQTGASSSRRLHRWVIAASVLGLTLLIMIVIRVQGSVQGVEFSPDYFQQRQFHFYEIPLLRLQLTPIRRIAESSATGKHLRLNGLINTPPGGPQQWHLVSLSRGLSGTTSADAQWLVDQLTLDQGGQRYWQQWSIDHADRARVLWPRIQTLALRELYFFVPGLLELAQRAPTPADLSLAADAYLIEQYRTLIRDMVAADRPALARALVAEAKAEFPSTGDHAAVDWDGLLAGDAP